MIEVVLIQVTETSYRVLELYSIPEAYISTEEDGSYLERLTGG